MAREQEGIMTFFGFPFFSLFHFYLLHMVVDTRGERDEKNEGSSRE